MRRLRMRFGWAVWGVLLPLLTTSVLAAESGARFEGRLTLNRVVLFKSGVGYFELRGRGQAGEGIPLDFKRDQMNDLLKSLTVLNLTGGGIGGIAYDTRKTVDQELNDDAFQFQKGDGLPQVLEQLQGSSIELQSGSSVFKGTIIGVERRMTLEGEAQVPSFHLSILDSDDNLRSFHTDEIAGVRFLDQKLSRQMERHLEIRFRRLRKDDQTVVITPTGKGMQDLIVSYVTEAPVWKATYRMVLPENGQSAKPFLQGWAIVDNVSGTEWKGVELSLVSGLPVSFVQNLYDPQYVQRPVVRMETETAAAPAVPEAGVRGERLQMAPAPMPRSDRVEMPSVAAGLKKEATSRDTVHLNERMRELRADAVTREVGEMFEYRIDHPVTIDRNQSALVPIVAKEIDAEAVDLYNESVRPGNPLAAVRLKNTTGLTLEGGPLTVLQGANYAGEALTATLKPNEQRYMTYAVDLGLRVQTRTGTHTEAVDRVVIDRGILQMHHAIIETKTYTLDNQGPHVKTVVIDHPYHPDWKLLNTEKPIETTDHFLRFEVKAAGLKATTFTVREMRDSWETLSVSSLTPDQVVLFTSRKYLSQKTRQQLQRMMALKSEITAIDRDLKALEKGRDEIFKDQKRLRENLQGLGQTTEEKELRGRYIQQLHQQETYLEKERGREKVLQGQLEAKQKELNAMIAALEQDLRVENEG